MLCNVLQDAYLDGIYSSSAGDLLMVLGHNKSCGFSQDTDLHVGQEFNAGHGE